VHLPPSPNSIATISKLTAGIRQLLEDAFPAVWVKGEISNLRYQSSGHIYFSLKDKAAQIGAVIFKANALRLPMQLKDGMEVVALGNLSVYEPRGTYQLIIRECIEEGAGRLQAEFERLKRMLEVEGLFSIESKKAIPLFPRAVGIITSPTGAALRDFVSILRRRNWTGRIVLFPAIVQGKEGAADILEKLQWAESYANLDLLVIGRGGGSIEDLWIFNEETVVRAVAKCTIPIISAVGHEIDFVLTDFAADKRAETPSAAAELISSGYVEVQKQIKLAATSILRNVRDQLRQKALLLTHQSSRLRSNAPNRIIENRHLRLDELQERMRSRITSGVQHKQGNMRFTSERFRHLHPLRFIENQKSQLHQYGLQLNKELHHRSQVKNQQLEAIEKRFENLSIEKVLARGYALIRDDRGKVITRTQKLRHGKQIEIQLKDGKRNATIQNAEQLGLFD